MNGKAYAIGGNDGAQVLDVNEVYTPGLNGVAVGFEDTGYFPNPTDGLIRLGHRADPSPSPRILVTNVLGEVVRVIAMPGASVDLTGLVPGVCTLTIEEGGDRTDRRIVAQ